MPTKYREPVGGSAHARKDTERLNKQRAKEEQEREKQRRSWPRLELPSEYNGEIIYVHRKLYEGITKKVNVISSRVIGGSGGKLVIEYECRNWKGRKATYSRGTLELCDIGPGGQ